MSSTERRTRASRQATEIPSTSVALRRPMNECVTSVANALMARNARCSTRALGQCLEGKVAVLLASSLFPSSLPLDSRRRRALSQRSGKKQMERTSNPARTSMKKSRKRSAPEA